MDVENGATAFPRSLVSSLDLRGVHKPLHDVDHLFLEVLGEVLAYRLEEDEKSLVAPTLTALNTSPLPW
jgi:hypothetical protein